MSFLFILLSTLFQFNLSTNTWVDKINHIIVLMLENRSFDHMLGYLKQINPQINGCLPSIGQQCSNPKDPSNSNSGLVYVGNEAVYVQPGDPSHSMPDTAFEEYGIPYGTQTNYYPAPMNGFIKQYDQVSHNKNGSEIMECFDNSSVPIIQTLANEFGVFDTWFADVPGPTEPNRLYGMMGSSKGMANNDDVRLVEGFVGESVFKMIDKYAEYPNNNQTWGVYLTDAPTALFVEYTRDHPYKYHDIRKLYSDINNGTLPLYSWVEPAYYQVSREFPASDQHPNHDVRYGEQLMKEIYETLRSSDIWEQSLFVIYYDEHGGFFDHVSPPINVPNPDNLNATKFNPPFNFTRLGVRTPAVFISPYIAKSTVISNNNPNTPQYSHSSLLHTIRNNYAPKSPKLSNREDWSLTCDNIINLDKPRKDCLVKLPDVPKIDDNKVHKDMCNGWINGVGQVNDLQVNIAKAMANVCGKSDQVDKFMNNERQLGLFVRECFKEWKQ